MDRQPTLESHLLLVRPLRAEDFDKLFLAASDPLIWEQHPESDRFKQDVFKRFFESAMSSSGAFAVIDNNLGEIIGSSRYYDFDAEQKSVIIGYTFLARKYWGGTYNGQLKNLMLTHAFKFCDKVLFHIGEKNIRSQMAIQKLGAKFSRKIEKDLLPNSKSDHLEFMINRFEA